MNCTSMPANKYTSTLWLLIHRYVLCIVTSSTTIFVQLRHGDIHISNETSGFHVMIIIFSKIMKMALLRGGQMRCQDLKALLSHYHGFIFPYHLKIRIHLCCWFRLHLLRWRDDHVPSLKSLLIFSVVIVFLPLLSFQLLNIKSTHLLSFFDIAAIISLWSLPF